MRTAARFAALALVPFAACARGEGGPWQVRVEMQVVSVTPAAALDLVPALRDPHKVDATIADLQTRIALGEAVLVAWPVVWARNGERVVSETTDEPRSSTEFDPPTETQNFGSGQKKPGLKDFVEVQRSRRFPDLDGLPAAYETRNVGITMDVVPSVSSDGAWVDAAITPMHVALLGTKRVRTGKIGIGGPRLVEVPEFFTAQITTQMRVRSGEWKLLGVFVVPKPEPHVELFILRATARSVAP